MQYRVRVRFDAYLCYSVFAHNLDRLTPETHRRRDRPCGSRLQTHAFCACDAQFRNDLCAVRALTENSRQPLCQSVTCDKQTKELS